MTSKRGAGTIAAVAVKSFIEMPTPPTIPFLGSLSTWKFSVKAIEDYHNELRRLYNKLGPIFREKLPFGFGSVVHVFEPEDARQIFLSDGKKPYIVPLQSTTQKYREIRGMNPGLGNLNGEEWYRLRSEVSQAMMKPQAVYEYLPHVNEVADRLVSHIAESKDLNQEVDMRVIAGRWSLESAGLIVFEKRLGAISNNMVWADRMIELNRQVFQLSAKMRFGPPFYKYITTPNWRKMVNIEDKFYWEVDKLSTEAIEKLSREKSGSEKTKFASKLINKPNLSDNDIKTILLSLFTDGLSTTAPSLIYNLFVLAKNPEKQAILRREINQVNPDKKAWTPELINRMSYLRACIKEAFRMYTITTEISRVPQKDIILGGYFIPAKTPIDIHTSLMLSDASNFSDAKEFKPERWLRENSSREDNRPFLLIPFGHGPRMCAGRRFAEQDLHVVIARLVSAYQISHNYSPIKQIYQTLLMPSGDLRFKFEPV